MNHSHYIIFEGLDNTGKSTQIERVARHLTREGCDIFVTKEPGGTYLLQPLRSILQDADNIINPLAELFLFMADRAEHAELVMRKLAQGYIVLSDRGWLSTVAYQGYGRGIDLKAIEQLNTIALQGLKSHILLFDCDPILRSCRGGATDRIEAEPEDFQARVRQGYLSYISKPNVCLIDASKDFDSVSAQCINSILDIIESVGKK